MKGIWDSPVKKKQKFHSLLIRGKLLFVVMFLPVESSLQKLYIYGMSDFEKRWKIREILKPEISIRKPQADKQLRNSFQTSLLKTCMHVFVYKDEDICFICICVCVCVYLYISTYRYMYSQPLNSTGWGCWFLLSQKSMYKLTLLKLSY